MHINTLHNVMFDENKQREIQRIGSETIRNCFNDLTEFEKHCTMAPKINPNNRIYDWDAVTDSIYELKSKNFIFPEESKIKIESKEELCRPSQETRSKLRRKRKKRK